MRAAKICAAALAAQITATVAFGADAQGRYAANYPATLPCADVAAAQAGSEELFAVAAFVEGWFAAHAKLTPGIFDYTPWQPVEYVVAQLRAYCTARPDDVLLAGLNQLTTFLEPDAMREAENPQLVGNGEQAVFVYPGVLAEVQAQLRARGFASADDLDPVTGLSAFQRSEGIAESGLPDQITLQRLFAQ